jgi:hypothetical protein
MLPLLPPVHLLLPLLLPVHLLLPLLPPVHLLLPLLPPVHRPLFLPRCHNGAGCTRLPVDCMDSTDHCLAAASRRRLTVQ